MMRFCAASARVKAADLLGWGYTISDAYWRAELLLPDEYDVDNFALRDLGQSDRQVLWPEADMALNQDPGVIPVGWRAFSHLYYNQESIPLTWLEVLTGGQEIVFPYTTCIHRKNNISTVACAVFYYDEVHRTIDCRGVDRWTTGATLPIAVYQIGTPSV